MTWKRTPGRPAAAPLVHAGSRLLLLAATLFAATAIPPQAQQRDPAPPVGAGAAHAAPEAISPDSIPLRASEDEARLQEIRLLVGTIDPRVEELEASLPSELEAIDRLGSTSEGQALDQFSVSMLSSLRFQWESHGKTLADWQGRLQRRSSALSGRVETLRAMLGVWIRTREEARGARAPQALIERIDSLLRTRAEIDSVVHERLAALLTLQSRVSSRQTLVGEALQRVATAADQAGRRLFTLDSDPLWLVMGGPKGTGDLAGQILMAWRQRVADISRFQSENAARARLHLVFSGALVLAMLVVRRRTRHLALGVPGADHPARLFDRPVSAALVLAIVATRWIYQYPTMAVYELMLLALVFPILRLLPRILDQRMRLPLYVLATLFVLDRLHQLAAGQPLLHRMLLVVAGIVGIALFVWATVQQRRAVTTRSRWRSLAGGLMQVAAVVLSTAVVANLAGAVALARLLTTAVLTSSFLGIVLLAAVLVLDTLINLSLGIRTQEPAPPSRFHAETMARWSRVVIHLAAGLLWLRMTLVLFVAYHPLMRGVTLLLARRWRYGQFDVSIGELLSFAVVLTIGYALSRILPLILEEGVLVRSSVPLGLRATISTLARFGLLTLGFLAALSAAGVGLGQFTLVAGALGVGIGFGLQNLVSNFVSGLILAFERPVEVGDSVQVGGLVGRVRHIGLRSSILQTPAGAEVILPNANLISNEVINWSLSDSRCRVELPVSVAYGTDPRRLIEMLAGVARGQAEVLASPAPAAHFRGFGESSLDFLLFFWAPAFEDSLRLRSEVAVAVHDALRQAGIEVPLPQRDLHLRSVSPAAGQAFGRPPSEPGSG